MSSPYLPLKPKAYLEGKNLVSHRGQTTVLLDRPVSCSDTTFAWLSLLQPSNWLLLEDTAGLLGYNCDNSRREMKG
jgi:hypothetical protein